MLSMTGYGQAGRSSGALEIVAEVRSVNSRFLDVKVRLPREVFSLENDIRKLIQSRWSRGRVEIFVGISGEGHEQFEWNRPLLQSCRQLAEAAQEMGIPGTLDLAAVLSLPGALIRRELDLSSGELAEAVLETAAEALGRADAERVREGEALKDEFGGRLERMNRLLDAIGTGADRIAEYHRQKLRERVASLREDATLDDSRLAQEILFYAERSSIAEETARLAGHLERFQAYLDQPGREGIGRNLDFLCQELNREANTILSKSPLPETSELAVELKVEIDKVREQVQNVE